MNEEQTKQFFASKPNAPHRINVGGKLAFANMPKEMQSNIKKRIAEKDEVMARGLSGELPGLKIDGKQVTRENLHEFEIPEMTRFVKGAKPKKEEPKAKEDNKYTKEDLELMTFKQLKVIGKKFGTTDRSKDKLIKEILNLQ